MTTILIILIPLAFIAGGFVAYKGVHLGLRWQYELKQDKQPTFEVPNPLTPIVEVIQENQQAKQTEEVKSVVDEWLNGEKER